MLKKDYDDAPLYQGNQIIQDKQVEKSNIFR